MPDAARKRTGPGPPPLLSLLRPLPGPAHLQPHRMLLDVHGMHRLLTIVESGTAKSINPFIYNPFKPVPPCALPCKHDMSVSLVVACCRTCCCLTTLQLYVSMKLSAL